MHHFLVTDLTVSHRAKAPIEIPDASILIQAPEDLDQVRFPLSRLVSIWNALPGSTPLTKFRSRQVAIERLWAAFEVLPVSTGASKKDYLIELLKRPAGVTIDQMVTATGWQRHSIRGVMSGVLRKKLGLNIVSTVEDSQRIYRIAA